MPIDQKLVRRGYSNNALFDNSTELNLVQHIYEL